MTDHTAETDSTIPALLHRRRALAVLGGAGLAAAAAACTLPTSSGGSSTTAGGGSSSGLTPGETGGPFPADGSNSNGSGAIANILDDVGVIRADIRSDLDGSDTQPGVPMTLQMRILDQSAGNAPIAGAAVYVWHCNRDGKYSEYNSPMNGGDYSAYSWLRGVQVTDANGLVTFRTILPGRYQGRAFHIHFEVFSDSGFGTKLLTSQLAADDATVTGFYQQASGYSGALAASTSNSADNVFGDGVSRQLLTWSGDVASGLTATIDVIVA